MFETIGVLIVFFILLSIGISVYFMLQKSSYSKEALQRRQLQAFELVQKMLYMPELDCVNVIAATEENCFEKPKIKALRMLLQTPDAQNDYYKTFGLSNISIKIVYPAEETLNIYERTARNYTNIFKTQSPIIVKDPVTEQNAFAYVEITSYVQEQ